MVLLDLVAASWYFAALLVLQLIATLPTHHGYAGCRAIVACAHVRLFPRSHLCVKPAESPSPPLLLHGCSFAWRFQNNDLGAIVPEEMKAAGVTMTIRNRYYLFLARFAPWFRFISLLTSALYERHEIQRFFKCLRRLKSSSNPLKSVRSMNFPVLAGIYSCGQSIRR